MKLRASEDALVAHLEGEAVLLNMTTKEYFRLNETAQAVWRLIEAGTGVEADIVRAIVAEYEVDAGAAAAEVGRVLRELLDVGLLEAGPAA